MSDNKYKREWFEPYYMDNEDTCNIEEFNDNNGYDEIDRKALAMLQPGEHVWLGLGQGHKVTML